MDTFGSYIKNKRRALKITQIELGREIRCSQSYIVGLELNEIVPDILTIYKLYKTLNLGMKPDIIASKFFAIHEDVVYSDVVINDIKHIINLVEYEPEILKGKLDIFIPDKIEDSLDFNNYFVYQVEDDMMNLLYNKGDKLLIKKDFKVESNNIYLISYNGKKIIRQLFMQGRYISLIAKNRYTNFDTIIAKINNLKIIGLVVGKK